MAIGVTPTACATRRMVTAAAPSARRIAFAAATTFWLVEGSSTPYTCMVYTVDPVGGGHHQGLPGVEVRVDRCHDATARRRSRSGARPARALDPHLADRRGDRGVHRARARPVRLPAEPDAPGAPHRRRAP